MIIDWDVRMGLKDIATKYKNDRVVRSVIINVMALFVTFLLFEPTYKTDDYDMCNILYGGITGKYSPNILYSNPLFGDMCILGLKICPNIPWYFVLQYLLLLIANIVLTIIIAKDVRNTYYKIIVFLYYLYFGYEFYVKITFSKTAGFLMFSGLLCFLCYILEKKKKFICIGFSLIFLGGLLRHGFFKIVAISMVLAFVIILFKNHVNKKKTIVDCIKLLIFIYISLLMVKAEAVYSDYRYRTAENWESYLDDNMKRAALTDFGIPEYDKYSNEYTKLGVKKIDYEMWFMISSRDDWDRVDNDLYSSIVLFRSQNKDFKQVLNWAFKGCFGYFKNNFLASFFIINLFVCVYLCGDKKMFFFAGCMMGIVLTSYIYLSYIGRYRSHVDDLIFICPSLLFLYYFKEYKMKKNKGIVSICIITILSLLNNYNNLVTSYYGGYYPSFGYVESEKERYKENYSIMRRLSEDKKHLYISLPADTDRIYPCFSVFEVIEKNFYSNIYRTNMGHIPVYRKCVENYGINNIFKDAVNSEVIRFVCSKENEEQMNIIEEYIRENYEISASTQLIEENDYISVYKITE